MESPYPDDDGEDAREGIAAHWVAAQVLGGHCALEELTDRVAPNGVFVTGEMVEHVETYIAAIRAVTPLPMVVEQTIEIAPGLIEPGTPDAWRVIERFAFLFDLKYGWAIVDAENNWQLMCYAIGIFRKHNWELDAVFASIVQPRPFHHEGRVRCWEISRDMAIAWERQVQARAQLTQDPRAPCVTGNHCRHCLGLHGCEAARRAGLNAIDVSLITTPAPLTGDALASEIRTLRAAERAIKLRLDASEQHACNIISTGGAVPGFSMERAYGNRRFKSAEDVAVLEMLTGLDLHERKPLTPSAAEKKGAARALIDTMTTRPETGRKLVARDASAKAKEVFK